MSRTNSSTTGPAAAADLPAAPAGPGDLYAVVLKGVWLSVLLGLLIQATILVVKNIAPDAKVIPEAGQRVTWSVLVCSALAIGNSLAKARPILLGWIGLLAGPAAFGVARAVNKSLNVGGGGGGFPIPSPIEQAIMRGVEYAIFGVLIGFAGRKGSLRSYMNVGAMLGVVFAVYHIARLCLANSSSPPATEIVARALNELMFPVGCALILWVTTEVGRQLAARGEAPEPRPIAEG